MVLLNEQQLQYIEELLLQKKINDDDFRAELLDHIATEIEWKMSCDQSFQQATKLTFESFKEDEMKEIQSQVLAIKNHKQFIMKRLALVVFALLLVTSLVWSFNTEPPSRSPLAGDFKVTSGFGKRLHPIKKVYKQHRGIDYKVPMGTPIFATADGIVIKIAESTTGYGHHIIIQHDENYQSVYAQLSTMEVIVGQSVKKGDLIAKSGNSGASTAPHLHYEVRKDGQAENPERYMKP